MKNGKDIRRTFEIQPVRASDLGTILTVHARYCPSEYSVRTYTLHKYLSEYRFVSLEADRPSFKNRREISFLLFSLFFFLFFIFFCYLFSPSLLLLSLFKLKTRPVSKSDFKEQPADSISRAASSSAIVKNHFANRFCRPTLAYIARSSSHTLFFLAF